PLIDDELYTRAQAAVLSHTRFPHQASGRHLLTGFLICPACGNRMWGTEYSRAKYEHKRYHCTGADRTTGPGGRTCTWTCASRLIEDVVLAEVRALLAPFSLADRHWQTGLRRAWRELQQPGDLATFREKRRVDLERAQDKARERLTRAALMLV